MAINITAGEAVVTATISAPNSLESNQSAPATIEVSGEAQTVEVSTNSTLGGPAGSVSGQVDLSTTAPTPPANGNVTLFLRTIAGRHIPAFIGPSGLDTVIQPMLARNKIGRYTPAGGSTISSDGLINPSTTTVGVRNPSMANLFTRTRRCGFSTTTTAGNIAFIRHNSSAFSIGNGSGLGGFFHVSRFGISALGDNTTRGFFGMATAGAPANVEPTSLLNAVGIGTIAGGSTMRFICNGSQAQTAIDLGENFPSNTSNIDVYELALFSAPMISDTISWQVTRLNTGHVAQGTVTGDSTQLPYGMICAGTFWITNNTAAAVSAFDLVSLYIETDY